MDTGANSNHYAPGTQATNSYKLKEPIVVKTAGNEIQLDQVMDHLEFGPGLYNPHTQYDLTSWGSLMKTLRAVHSEGQAHLRHDPAGRKPVTAEHNGLLHLKPAQDEGGFLEEFAHLVSRRDLEPSVFLVSAAERLELLWLPHRHEGHAPPRALRAMLRTEQYRDLGLRAEDVGDLDFADCPVCLRYKTTARTNTGNTMYDAPVGSTLFMDLAFFKVAETSYTVLVAKESTVGYLLAKVLEQKTADQIFEAITEFKGSLASNGFQLGRIHCDSEHCFSALQGRLLSVGVTMILCPPGEHERVAERFIQTLKRTMRAIAGDVDYPLPVRCFPYLVKWAVRVTNH